MKRREVLALVAVVAVVVSACSSGEAVLTTTSTLVAGTTAPAAVVSTTTTSIPESPGTTLRGESVADYEVVLRSTTDDGETLFVVIPPGAYTDVDLENFIIDLIEANPGLWGVEVFDDEEALRIFVLPEGERTEEQQQFLAEHHFISLVQGDTIRFQGPFADVGEFPLGS